MKWIAVVALVLSATACGSDDDEGPRPGELPFIPELSGAEPAAKDMTMEHCDLGVGSQAAEGTVTNSGNVAADYVITINWVNDAFDLRGQGVDVVEDLAPGASQDWSVTGQVLDGATQCVPSTFKGELDQ